MRVPEIRKYSYNQRLKDLKRIFRWPLIDMYEFLNGFTTASEKGRVDNELSARATNNGAKLIVKQFQRISYSTFLPNKITTTQNSALNEVVISRTLN